MRREPASDEVEARCDKCGSQCDANGISSSFKGSAFTLIELLVVIAIIAILAAMVLPAMTRAKQQGKCARCIGNLRRLGIALKLYVDDNDQRYPYFWVYWASSNSVFKVLEPYQRVQWTNPAYHCPGYREPILDVTPVGLGPVGSYGYNGYGTFDVFSAYSLVAASWCLGLSSPGGTPGDFFRGIPAFRESAVAVPSDMLAFADTRLTTDYGGPPYLPLGTWAGTPLLSFGRVSLVTPYPYPFRHGKNYNAVYCDGHVQGMPPTALYNTNVAASWNNDHQPHPETWP